MGEYNAVDIEAIYEDATEVDEYMENEAENMSREDDALNTQIALASGSITHSF